MSQPTFFEKEIKNVLLVFREGKEEARTLCENLADFLTKKGIQVFKASHQNLKSKGRPFQNFSKDTPVDLAISLGGDGTYLEVARLIDETSVPILGINLGSLGFLTASPAEKLMTSVQLVLDGKMQVRRRSLLLAQLFRGESQAESYKALNDIVIERGDAPHLIRTEISIDSVLVSVLKSDGLIMATPTGSSAYNLAAGGPILHPEVASFVICPVCPHSLTQRPLIVPDNRKVEFKFVGSGEAHLTVDGQRVGTLGTGDKVLLQRNPTDHLILREESHNYFGLLKEKLMFSRT